MMNNKPVAWMRESDKAVCSNEEKLWFIEEEGSDWNYKIPLYTHPVNTCKHGVDDGACKECYQEVTRPAKEYFEDGPQAEELHEILQSNANPIKELTDEEIDEVVRRWFGNSRYDFSANTWRQFSRAILRKAQEK